MLGKFGLKSMKKQRIVSYGSADGDSLGFFGDDGVGSDLVSRVRRVYRGGVAWVKDVTVGRYQRRKKDKADAGVVGEHDSHRFVLGMKPQQGYVFRSDYFVVDGGRVGCILSFTHDDGMRDTFPAFWGVYRLPYRLSKDVSVVLLEQAVRMSDDWISRHNATADRLASIASNAADSGTDKRKKFRVSKRSNDLSVVGQELVDGASYVNVHGRLVVYASSVELLDEAILDIENSYSQSARIPSVGVQSFMGDQLHELSTLFAPCDLKRGKGFYFTSTEYAGAYHLTGRGVSDSRGLYMGMMVGDVNNSAVLLDVNGFSSHVVIADSRRFGSVDGTRRVELRPRLSDMCALKVSQGVLLDGGRVVHVVLNGCDVRGLIGGLVDSTIVVDGFRTAVNPLEVFGDKEDSLHLFEATVNRIVALVRQIHSEDDGNWSVLEGKISEVLTDFYIDNGMWVKNAKNQLSRVRLVGIPHKDVPRLSMFMAYLRKAKKALEQSGSRDAQEYQVLNVLLSVFGKLLDVNGDLFDVVSCADVDVVKDSRRVIVDVSSLVKRSSRVMMAQLVNLLGLGTWGVGKGDVIVFHGTNLLSGSVKTYVEDVVARVKAVGGRVVWSYDVLSSGDGGCGVFDDMAFNALDKASYTLFGQMSENELIRYGEVTKKRIPGGLSNFVVNSSDASMSGGSRLFLHRGTENVVFTADFSLGPQFKKYIESIQ